MVFIEHCKVGEGLELQTVFKRRSRVVGKQLVNVVTVTFNQVRILLGCVVGGIKSKRRWSRGLYRRVEDILD